MKCEKCGGNLSLEDVVCPHCDTLNEHAVQHIRDMNKYKKDYEGTKQEVYTVTKSYAGISVRIVIIAILVVLIVACSLLSEEFYSMKRKSEQAKSKKNVTEYKAQMEEYLEDRDYYALSAFITNKYIDTYSEDYEEYRAIEHAARYYEYLYEVIMRANVSADTYDKQSSANMIAEYVNKFYEIFDESIAGYSYIGDSGKSREAALEMEEQIHALLIGYCGLTKEDVAEFMSMSDAARALVIEERMSDGE